MFAASKSGRAASAVATDPYFPYVPLLLNTTSTNGQQNNTFLDSSTNNFTITRNGTPTQGSVTPYWPNGQWSNNFNGSSDYLTVPTNTAFDFGSGNFTIEFWIQTTSTRQYDAVITREPASVSGAWAMLINVASSTAGDVALYSYDYNANVSPMIVTTGASVTNAGWHHVALVRNGSQWVIYIDGTSRGTQTSSVTIGALSASLYIGNNQAIPTRYFPGYISNLRIVKGTAVYTGAFTPSTTPLTAITNTSLLTCQSNRFRDNSTNNFTITANSTPKVQAFQPFSPTASYTAAAYGGSGYFNGSTDYLSAPSNAAFALGTGDFTIECWIYLLAVPTGFADIAFIGNYGTPSNGFYFNFRSSGTIGITDATTVYALSATALVANTWYHVAAVRSSGSSKIYVNGVGGTAVAFSGNIAQNTLYIGNSGSAAAGGFVNGYISNHRVVKGTAVYTANFTPPTAPLTAITNTSLLLNYTNAGIYDAAVQNNAITVGDAQASTTQPKWSPTSMKFDGTGDSLTMPASSNLDLGSGNFTIEFWAYSTATTNSVDSVFGYGGFTIMFYHNASIWTLEISNNGTSNQVVLTTAYTANDWFYFAITRSGTTVTLYKNSASQGTGTITGAVNTSGKSLAIGDNNAGANQRFTGYIQDFRITKGVARTITTPTAAFPTR